MGVPALEESVGLAKLGEVGIETNLGQPVDEVTHVIEAHGALDADATVAVRGGLGDAAGAARQVDRRQILAVVTGADPATAELGEIPVGGEQDAARIAAGDD